MSKIAQCLLIITTCYITDLHENVFYQGLEDKQGLRGWITIHPDREDLLIPVYCDFVYSVTERKKNEKETSNDCNRRSCDDR